MTRITMF